MLLFSIEHLIDAPWREGVSIQSFFHGFVVFQKQLVQLAKDEVHRFFQMKEERFSQRELGGVKHSC